MTTLTIAYSKIFSLSLPKVNWKVVFVVSLPALVLALLFYAWQASSLAGQYYLIENFEKRISKLTEANKDLQLNFAESSFLGQVVLKAEQMDFEKSSAVKYIQIQDDSVAVNGAKK